MKIYNTMSRHKEELVPQNPRALTMYVCGPTVYNYIHIGNARPFVVFDTMRKYLEYRGQKVKFVQNFTDVDDKIINRAREEGITAMEVADKYIEAYYEDVKALNITKATVHPRVSQTIPDIIAFVQGLIDKGLAYEVDGDVYYSTRKFPRYGLLSGNFIENLEVGARIPEGEKKRDPLDFALWKAAKPGEPAWDSPWGQGRPGWHIECSAMSCKYLGSAFDIHGGGADLVFPHHEDELAQSKAAGDEFAKYWMHNGFITVNEEKMSKSLGNFFLLRDILAKFPGDVVRCYLLSTHYRSPIDFSDDKLHAAARSLARIRNSYGLLQEAAKKPAEVEDRLQARVEQARGEFIEAMDDDFNTALAFSVIFNFCHDLNAALNEGPLSAADAAAAQKLFADFESVLGCLLPQEEAKDDGLADALMDLILTIRQQARKNKDWATADAIRDKLKELGIVIEDTAEGARWKRA